VADGLQAVLIEEMVVLNRNRVRRGATAALVVAISGAAGLVAIGLFFSVGQPFGTINDVLGLVMVVSLAPVMLAHYELGGPVPLWPARLSLGGATLAVAGWALLQAAFITGLLGVDVNAPAVGGWVVQAVLQVVIGLWIAGASLLAGRWLPLAVRLLGVLTGLGVAIMAIGLLHGGYADMLTNVGGIGYQILLPIWAFVLGRIFGARAEATSSVAGTVAA
jgi:hypothetical protein